MMKTKYRNVDSSTIEGLKEAERLHAAGWTCYFVGLFFMKFYKREEAK